MCRLFSYFNMDEYGLMCYNMAEYKNNKAYTVLMAATL